MKSSYFLYLSLFLLIYSCSNSNTNLPIAEPTNSKIDGSELSVLKKQLENWHFSKDEQGVEMALKYVGHEDQSIRNAARMILENNDPKKWVDALKNADSFNQEVTLLTALIRRDSTHDYQQLINNRLQTFDLRHLSDKEKLAIIRLYELNFTRNEQPSEGMIQTAYAKLNAAYPADNEIMNKELSRLLDFLESQLTDQ